MAKKKIGLALSSGTARGLAHIGVLEILRKEGIHIDMIAGTSAGALVGAIYAQRKNTSQTEELLKDLISKRFTIMRDLGLGKSGLIQGRKFKHWLTSIIDGVEFGDLSIPFACVATDIDTGEEIVIEQGSVVEAVRASVSIPGILTVVKWKNRYLVDGSLVNPVPVSVLKKMGADFIIAVNVVPDIRDRMPQPSEEQKEDSKEPNIFNVMIRIVHIASYQAVKSSMNGADIVIEPQVSHIGFADFHRVRECIAKGALATQRSIPEIREKLNNI